MRMWAGVALAGCAAVALAYLPPRGFPRDTARAASVQRSSPTPARMRAQQLAQEWRATDVAHRLLEERARVRLAQDRSAGVTVAIRSEPPVAPQVTRRVEAWMDTVWRRIGLAETKVRVHLVLDLSQAVGASATPRPERAGAAYLAPDSTDRTTCIAIARPGSYWTRFILDPASGRERASGPQFLEWLQASLGPCGFYAAFGTPAKPVRRWLDARSWDLALYLQADSLKTTLFRLGLQEASDPWFWEFVYRVSPAGVACIAGRPDGCRAAVLAHAEASLGSPEPVPRVVQAERRWWREQRLLGGGRYLSDVARAIGRERFLEFWTSPLPVDTSLAAALRQPLGEWTADWQEGFAARIRLGPAAPLGGMVAALGLAAAALLAVAGAAARRQVR
ncbi:MAG: hypothetical protein ACREMN_04325 [Gemmatimonadales bacterium]